MSGAPSEAPVLSAEGLAKRFPTGRRGVFVNAVNGVSLSLARGETLGLVGESGSGKSTIGLMVSRLLPVTEGRIAFLGEDVTALSDQAFRPRRKALQIVFQDPWSALNPRMSIIRLLEEPYRLHTDLDAGARRARAAALADRVHLPRASLARFPHELSGGQLQRVCIARAIATNPSLVVLDEPTSSLDLSVRAGILRLLDELEAETRVAMLFISHDLDTVELISDRILVLYLGTVVEEGPASQVFAAPAHPYTQMLLSAHLPPDPKARPARVLPRGEIPSPIDLPPGCPFVSRCPLAEPRCRDALPPPHPAGPGQVARCVRVPEGTSRIVPA